MGISGVYERINPPGAGGQEKREVEQLRIKALFQAHQIRSRNSLQEELGCSSRFAFFAAERTGVRLIPLRNCSSFRILSVPPISGGNLSHITHNPFITCR